MATKTAKLSNIQNPAYVSAMTASSKAIENALEALMIACEECMDAADAMDRHAGAMDAKSAKHAMRLIRRADAFRLLAETIEEMTP